MAGMYPDNQTISLFGEEVTWPGVDPQTGKFTNGDFSNPLKKPSFIPAETINLILDNLANLIDSLGGTPDNTDPEQLRRIIELTLERKANLESPNFTGVPTLNGKPILPFDDQYPVGSLFETVDPTKLPGANIPGVVWTEYGRGQKIVGVDDSAEFSPDTTKPFNMREGGAKTVQLTANQSGLRQHGHGDGNHNHGYNNVTSYIPNVGGYAPDGTVPETGSWPLLFRGSPTNGNAASGSGSHIKSRALEFNLANGGFSIHHCGSIIGEQGPWGASEAHPNLDPYKTAYRYVRTA